MEKKDYNNCYMIDIYRFIFTLAVCLMHFESAFFHSENRIFEGSYLAVEFFFILSGYLLAKEFESKKYENAEVYTLKRLKELIPYNLFMLFCFYIWYVWQMILDGEKSYGMCLEVIKKGMYLFYEAIFLQMFFPSEMLNHPIWYISVLIIVGYAYYCYLNKYKKLGGIFNYNFSLYVSV